MEKYVVIKLGHEYYGINVLRIESIERISPITRVPKVPAHVLGVINLRGVVTPVIDLRVRLGFEPCRQSEDTRIVVVNIDAGCLGMIVESTHDVVEVEDNMIMPPPRQEQVSYIKGVVQKNGQVLTLLDINKTITDE